MTKRNLMLIPVMCYTEVSMVTLSSLGFFYGVFDRTGFFHYRTPKSGSAKEKDSTSTTKSSNSEDSQMTETR